MDHGPPPTHCGVDRGGDADRAGFGTHAPGAARPSHGCSRAAALERPRAGAAVRGSTGTKQSLRGPRVIIQPIVEGQGEVAAVPVLLRRLRDEAQCWRLEVGNPHRRRRSQLVKKDSLQSAVQVAALRDHCAGILVLLDADDDCPKELAPTLQEWAQEAAGEKPCVVVMANREYEAWFLASIEALRGKAGILPDAASHSQPEIPRDAKGELE